MATWSPVKSYLFTPFGPSLSDLAPEARFRRVLDLGCGDGKNTQALAHAADDVWGVDSNHHLIQSAKDAFPHGHFVARPAEEYLRETELTFDGIVCARLLGFIPDLNALFQPLRRCATGHLILCDWHPLGCWITPDGVIGKDYSAEGLFSPGQFHHSAESIAAGLIANGFRIQRIVEGPSRRADPFFTSARAEVLGLPLAMCWICTI